MHYRPVYGPRRELDIWLEWNNRDAILHYRHYCINKRFCDVSQFSQCPRQNITSLKASMCFGWRRPHDVLLWTNNHPSIKLPFSPSPPYCAYFSSHRTGMQVPHTHRGPVCPTHVSTVALQQRCWFVKIENLALGRTSSWWSLGPGKLSHYLRES